MSLYYWVYEVLQQSGHGIHVWFLCILSEHDKKLKQKDQILWAWQKTIELKIYSCCQNCR